MITNRESQAAAGFYESLHSVPFSDAEERVDEEGRVKYVTEVSRDGDLVLRMEKS